MARTAKSITSDSKTRKELEHLANSQTTEVRLARRAKMILGCLEGMRIIDIADKLGEQPDVIIKWRNRFVARGITGLNDEKRPGKPPVYDEQWQKAVLQKLEEKPPNGQSRWDSPTLAATLGTSEDAVQRFLQKQGIQLARMRTWCISTDPEFTAKAADIVGLYLNPPENAVVISIDEKPSMQALSRRTGFVKTSNGKIMSAIKSTYKRNGTQNLFAALEVATGTIHGKTTKAKKRVDFLAFMDDLLAELVVDDETEYHVILDNYCIHKRCDEWLLAHPNVHFHYTPTSASWLNQIEIWFNIMTRKVLRGASFDSTAQLSEAIAKYISAYNKSAKPFIWKKRDVKGSQIHDKLSNLRG
jgi:transposase